jgi:hypothetical protein
MSPWRGFLFWYLTLLCMLATGPVVDGGLLMLVGFHFDLVDGDVAMTVGEWVGKWMAYILCLASVLLCTVCARAHGLGFWLGVLGWTAGIVLVAMLFAPLVFAPGTLSSIALFPGMLIFSAGLVLRRWRRIVRRQRDVLQAFD